MVGKDFGNYFIEKELGKGGMATVYLAMHKNLGRKVAVKVMHPHLAADREARIRFEREAKAVARLEHVNILQIYDFGSVNECFYIAMELVEGEDAEKLVQRNGPMPGEIAASIFCGVANGLFQAHSLHIIHRDIKLSNIIIKNDGVAKLSDFGIVKIDEAASLTSADSVVGTPYYLSPELVEGKDPSPQSDIYAFGVSLYYAVAGQYPYKKAPVPVLFNQIASGQYIPLKQTGHYVSENLAMIIEKCMERETVNRYENASLLARDLNSFLQKHEVQNDPTEIVRYLGKPKEYVKEQKERNIKIKLNRAETFKKKGLVFEALREYESLLELDPGNEEVKRNISTLGESFATAEKTDLNMATLVMPKKRKAHSPLLTIGIAVALILSGLGLWFFLRPLEKPEEPQAQAADWKDSLMAAKKALDSLTATRPPVEEPAAVPPAPAEPPARRPIQAAVPVAQTTLPAADGVPAPSEPAAPKADTCSGFLFVFSEMWGDIFLNGVKSGKAPMKENLPVACGDYRITIENPSGKSFVSDITIDSGRTTRIQVKISDFK